MARLISLSDEQIKYLEEAVRFAQVHSDFTPSNILDHNGNELDDDLLESLKFVRTQPDNTEVVHDFML